MKKGLIAFALLAITGAASAFSYQHVYEVNGIGSSWAQARNDARSQALETCNALGGTLMLEEIQTVTTGNLHIFYGLAHCNVP